MNNLPGSGDDLSFTIAGENAWLVTLKDDQDDASIAHILNFSRAIESCMQAKLIDLIPAYHSIVVIFDGWRCDHQQARQAILNAYYQCDFSTLSSTPTLTLPVLYNAATGPDLERLAQLHGLSTASLIEQHCAQTYQVFALGFAPGFAYLGHLPAHLSTPRLRTPRRAVPAGSVAIADRQTAVYPAESPGGWNIIGRCPLPLFDPQQTPATPFEVGGTVKFEAIDQQTFLDLGGSLPPSVTD